MKNNRINTEAGSNRVPDSGSYELFLAGRRVKLQLSWHDLYYSIKKGDERLNILKGVSGYTNLGEVLAIMGSSGSGKTSLLSILSNQFISQSNIDISGRVELNGTDIKLIDYNYYSKYVSQNDILFATLTPREIFMFNASLTTESSQQEIMKKVDLLLEELMLTKVADNLIGNVLIRGLSGGEKKRVSIGIELIPEPYILILDEPTSGLDSVTAEIVVKLLKNLAERGRIIIMTIHQPSLSIFNMIDRLILMIEGNFVYQGKAKKSKKYFNRLRYVCPFNTNPPDHFMRILYIFDRHRLTSEERERIDLFVTKYNKKKKKNNRESGQGRTDRTR